MNHIDAEVRQSSFFAGNGQPFRGFPNCQTPPASPPKSRLDGFGKEMGLDSGFRAEASSILRKRSVPDAANPLFQRLKAMGKRFRSRSRGSGQEDPSGDRTTGSGTDRRPGRCGERKPGRVEGPGRRQGTPLFEGPGCLQWRRWQYRSKGRSSAYGRKEGPDAGWLLRQKLTPLKVDRFAYLPSAALECKPAQANRAVQRIRAARKSPRSRLPIPKTAAKAWVHKPGPSRFNPSRRSSAVSRSNSRGRSSRMASKR